jgi:hypothetical protein
MKLIIFTITFVIALACHGGAGTFPQGDHVKLLKDKVEFKNITTQIIANDSDDPTSVAKNANFGSLYLKSDDGQVYRKTDAGSSTNWNRMLDSADGLLYFLLGGRAGGQVANGGTAAGDDLTLSSTANATKGNIFFGTSTYDEVNNRLGIGNVAPSVPLDVTGASLLGGNVTVGIGAAGVDYTLTFDGEDNDGIITWDEDNASWLFTDIFSIDDSLIVNDSGADVDSRFEGDNDANLLYVDASTDRIGVGTATPASKFDVNGTITAPLVNSKIVNGHAELDTSGWVAYNNTSAGVAPDDFGGVVSGNLTLTRNTTTPLRGLADFLITKNANNTQGEGFYYQFDIGKDNLSSLIKTTFDFIDSANYADGDIRVYLVSSSDSFVADFNVIEPNGAELKAGVQHYMNFLQSDSTDRDYRLCIHVASTNATAYTVNFDSVNVKKYENVAGTIGTDWESYTPTGGWVANTTYSGFWRRVGDNMEIRIDVNLTGAPTSAAFTASIPSGYAIDTAKLSGPVGSTGPVVGSSTLNDVGTASYIAQAIAYSSTEFRVITNSGAVTQASPFAWANTDKLSVIATVPIAGWSSNTVLSDTNSGREISEKYTTNTSQSISGVTIIKYEDPDPSNKTAMYNTTTGIGTVLESGFYTIKAQGHITQAATAAGQYFELAIHIDGTRKTAANAYAFNAQTSHEVDISDSVYLNRGQTFSIRADSTIGASRSLLGNTNLDYFSIVKNSSMQTIGAAEKIVLVATSNNGQTINTGGGTDAVYEDVIVDSHNAYNNSTGVWTAPRAGFLTVDARYSTASVSMSTTQTSFAQIRLNGSSIATGTTIGNGSANSYLVSIGLVGYPVNKGDQVKIVATPGVTTTMSTITHNNIFSLKLD